MRDSGVWMALSTCAMERMGKCGVIRRPCVGDERAIAGDGMAPAGDRGDRSGKGAFEQSAGKEQTSCDIINREIKIRHTQMAGKGQRITHASG